MCGNPGSFGPERPVARCHSVYRCAVLAVGHVRKPTQVDRQANL